MVSLIKGMVCAKQMIENWFRQLVTVKETWKLPMKVDESHWFIY
jgi:hypothetical protein